MPSAIKSFDQIASRLAKGANRAFDNEKAHREHIEARQAEALAAQEKFKAEEAAKQAEDAAQATIVAEISKLEKSNKLRVKQGFAAVYRQLAWLLPQEFKFTAASVRVIHGALLTASTTTSEMLDQWQTEIAEVTAEMVRKDEERAARIVQQAAEDKDYFERCCVLIQDLFHKGNPEVKNFYKLLEHLRSIIVSPRHRGLRGQEVIVAAIRHQMHGFSIRWHELLEKSLVRAQEREEAWRLRRQEAAKTKQRPVAKLGTMITKPAVEDKWAAEAAAAESYRAQHSAPAAEGSESAALTLEEGYAAETVTQEDIAALAAEADAAVEPTEPFAETVISEDAEVQNEA